jgi:hypothetical protein
MNGQQVSKLGFLRGAVDARIRKIAQTLLEKPNFDLLTTNLAVGGAPTKKTLARSGIDAVVDLRERKTGSEPTREYIHFPVKDHESPDVVDLVQLCKLIEEKTKSGTKVLVHCNMGRGRAPLVAASFLVWTGYSPYEALRQVLKTRSCAYLNPRQLAALTNFERLVQSSRSARP